MTMKRKDMYALVGLLLMVEAAVIYLTNLLYHMDFLPSRVAIVHVVIGAVLWFRNMDEAYAD